MKNLLILLLLSSLVIACEKTDFYENGFDRKNQISFKDEDVQTQVMFGLFNKDPMNNPTLEWDDCNSAQQICYIVVKASPEQIAVGDTVTTYIYDAGDTITRQGVVSLWDTTDANNHEIDMF